MIRIMGGRFKGRLLSAPRGLRPTTGQVRQALFNILGEAVEGARVLDAFAGTGAVGLEALSRGAACVVFVESHSEALACLHDNLDRMAQELPERPWRVVHLEMARAIPVLAEAERSFDLIVLDPPYGSAEGKKALKDLVAYAILTNNGLVAFEHDRRTEPPSSVESLRLWKRHRYGETVLSLYRA